VDVESGLKTWASVEAPTTTTGSFAASSFLGNEPMYPVESDVRVKPSAGASNHKRNFSVSFGRGVAKVSPTEAPLPVQEATPPARSTASPPAQQASSLLSGSSSNSTVHLPKMKVPWWIKRWLPFLPAEQTGQPIESQKLSAITTALSFVLVMTVGMGGYVAGRMYYYVNHDATNSTYAEWVACYFDAYYNGYSALIPGLMATDGTGRTFDDFYFDLGARTDFGHAVCGDSAATRSNKSVGAMLVIMWYFLSICGQALLVSLVLIRSKDVRAFFSARWWRVVGRIIYLVCAILVEETGIFFEDIRRFGGLTFSDNTSIEYRSPS
jgi:hypothetical protein